MGKNNRERRKKKTKSAKKGSNSRANSQRISPAQVYQKSAEDFEGLVQLCKSMEQIIDHQSLPPPSWVEHLAPLAGRPTTAALYHFTMGFMAYYLCDAPPCGDHAVIDHYKLIIEEVGEDWLYDVLSFYCRLSDIPKTLDEEAQLEQAQQRLERTAVAASEKALLNLIWQLAQKGPEKPKPSPVLRTWLMGTDLHRLASPLASVLALSRSPKAGQATISKLDEVLKRVDWADEPQWRAALATLLQIAITYRWQMTPEALQALWQEHPNLAKFCGDVAQPLTEATPKPVHLDFSNTESLLKQYYYLQTALHGKPLDYNEQLQWQLTRCRISAKAMKVLSQGRDEGRLLQSEINTLLKLSAQGVLRPEYRSETLGCLNTLWGWLADLVAEPSNNLELEPGVLTPFESYYTHHYQFALLTVMMHPKVQRQKGKLSPQHPIIAQPITKADPKIFLRLFSDTAQRHKNSVVKAYFTPLAAETRKRFLLYACQHTLSYSMGNYARQLWQDCVAFLFDLDTAPCNDAQHQRACEPEWLLCSALATITKADSRHSLHNWLTPSQMAPILSIMSTKTNQLRTPLASELLWQLLMALSEQQLAPVFATHVESVYQLAKQLPAGKNAHPAIRRILKNLSQADVPTTQQKAMERALAGKDPTHRDTPPSAPNQYAQQPKRTAAKKPSSHDA